MSCWKQSASFAVFHWGRSATLRSGQDQKFSDTAIIGREQRDIVIEKLAALDHRQGAVVQNKPMHALANDDHRVIVPQ
jgi:hypothetical protein